MSPEQKAAADIVFSDTGGVPIYYYKLFWKNCKRFRKIPRFVGQFIEILQLFWRIIHENQWYYLRIQSPAQWSPVSSGTGAPGWRRGNRCRDERQFRPAWRRSPAGQVHPCQTRHRRRCRSGAGTARAVCPGMLCTIF